MKQTKKLLCLFSLCGVAFSAGAVDDDSQTSCLGARIRGNWYIEAGAGAQILFSKDADQLEFGKRLTPLLSLTAGKWLSPYWGIRFQGTAYSMNGYSTYQGIYTADDAGSLIYGPNDPVRSEVTVYPDGSYRQYLRYMNLHADAQFSLFHIFGWQVAKKADLIPCIGIGYFQTFAYKGVPALASISTNFSLMAKYRIAKNWDINLEAQTAVLPDPFEGRIAGQRYECNLGVTAGLTWHLPYQPKFANCQSQPVSVAPVVKTVTDTVYVDRQVVVEKPVAAPSEKLSSFTLSAIRFRIGKHEPIAGQEMQYVNIANFMKANPNAKLKVFGYADKATGTEAYNLTLSALRAKKVCEILTEDYGIDRNRLEIQGWGANEQPYEENNWNRIVLVIPE